MTSSHLYIWIILMINPWKISGGGGGGRVVDCKRVWVGNLAKRLWSNFSRLWGVCPEVNTCQKNIDVTYVWCQHFDIRVLHYMYCIWICGIWNSKCEGKMYNINKQIVFFCIFFCVNNKRHSFPFSLTDTGDCKHTFKHSYLGIILFLREKERGEILSMFAQWQNTRFSSTEKRNICA